jgi:PAS domain S-box-containing protein
VVESALFRIAQEACTNIARHANARHASIDLRGDGRTVRVIVRDDGQGFDAEAALNSGRLGLLGMRERAEMLGGTFAVTSRPGAETEIVVEAPLLVPAADGPVAPAPEATAASGEPARRAQSAAAAPPALSEAAELARAKALSDALVDIAASITRSPSADAMLEFVVSRAARAVGCEMGTILRREGDTWVVSHGHNAPPDLLGRRLSDAEAPATTSAAATREIVVVNDVGPLGAEAGAAAGHFGVRAYACLPLFAGDTVIGSANFSYHTIPGVFRPSEVDFLRRLSSLVSLALENIQLRDRERQQKELLEAVFATAPVGIAVFGGDDLEIRMANAAYRGLTPRPELDPTGRRFAEMWAGAEGGDAGEVWARGVLKSRHPFDLDRYRVTFPDGSARYFSLHLRPLCWGGEPAGLAAIVDTSVTEQSAATARRLAAELDLLFSSIKDGLVEYDREGRIIRMNAAAREILGYSTRERAAGFRERTEAFVITKADGTPFEFAELPGQVALRGESVQGVLMALTRADRTTWLSVSAAPVVGPDRAQAGAVATFADITPLRNAQQELQESNRKLEAANQVAQAQARAAQQARAEAEALVSQLEAILSSAPDGLVVYDTDGRIVRQNAMARDLLGYSPDTEAQPIVERSRSVIHPQRPDGTPFAPEDFPALRALRGETVRGEQMVLSVPARGGGPAHLSVSSAPIRLPDGSIGGCVATFSDMGEFDRVSAELRRTNVELEAILSSVADGLVVNDMAGRVTRMSAAAEAMLRYTEEERLLPIRGRLPDRMRLVRPDGQPYAYEEYPPVRALNGETTVGEEMLMQLPPDMRQPGSDEREIWVLATAAPIRTDDGEMLGAVTILSDVSRQREAQTELERANAALREAAETLEQRVAERTASLETAQGQLRALSLRLVELQEEERAYVADQLYNQAAQVFAALKLQLWTLERKGQECAAEQVTELKRTVSQAMLALHDLASQLRPAALDRAALVEALRDYLLHWGEVEGVAVAYEVEPGADIALPPDEVTAVFRTVQEAATNVGQHAHALHLAVTIRREDGQLVIELADDGIGFDVSALFGGGAGLAGMQQRMEAVGGEMSIDSGPLGTTVRIAAPAPPQVPAAR